MRGLPTFAFLLATLIGWQVQASTPEIWKMRGWTKTDFSKKSVPFTDILSGGPPKDGIPSIDEPVFHAAKMETMVGLMEPVIRLEVNGAVKGYPLRVLTWHEIVNDTIGGVPVAVTYCPLCNSAIVFDRRLDGQVLDFGTTGMLRNSDLVMYDRQSETWWQQFIGRGIVGKHTGRELKMLPSRVEAFSSFKAEHPDAPLLIPNNPNLRDYGRNPYFRYDSSAKPFLYRGPMPKGIHPMARVVVVKDAKMSVALALLREKGSHTIGDLTFTWTKGQASALDATYIKEGKDVGNVTVHRKSANTNEPVVHDITFAFVVHAFFPEAEIIGKEQAKAP